MVTWIRSSKSCFEQENYNQHVGNTWKFHDMTASIGQVRQMICQIWGVGLSNSYHFQSSEFSEFPVHEFQDSKGIGQKKKAKLWTISLLPSTYSNYMQLWLLASRS